VPSGAIQTTPRQRPFSFSVIVFFSVSPESSSYQSTASSRAAATAAESAAKAGVSGGERSGLSKAFYECGPP